MRALPSSPPSQDGFAFLDPWWSKLHELGSGAEAVLHSHPSYCGVRLRSFLEELFNQLIEKMEISSLEEVSLFNRINYFQEQKFLKEAIVKKMHHIRMSGNQAAHGGTLTAARAETLLADAQSLARWFALFMRPEEDWQFSESSSRSAPKARSAAEETSSGSSASAQPASSSSSAGLPQSSTEPSSVYEDSSSILPAFKESDLAASIQAAQRLSPEELEPQTQIPLQEYGELELTEDQRACLVALESFLADPSQKIFLLKGFAGTGKTTILKAVTEYLSAESRPFLLAAPTGRAAKILAEKTGQSAQTIHRHIYQFETHKIADKNQEASDGAPAQQTIFSLKPLKSSANTVFIVDEASLVGNQESFSTELQMGSGRLLDDLLESLELKHPFSKRKLILVGDPAQLPPVGMNTSPALDEDYLEKNFGLGIAGAQLCEVVRQKGDGALSRNVEMLRGQQLAPTTYFQLEFDTEMMELSADQFKQNYLALQRELGLANIIVVTYTNQDAAQYNAIIRDLLFPGKPAVVVGERLMLTSNTFIGGELLANGEIVGVNAVSENAERRTVYVKAGQGSAAGGAVELVFREVEIEASASQGKFAIIRAKLLETTLLNVFDTPAVKGGNPGNSKALISQALQADFNTRYPGLKQEANKEEYESRRSSDPYLNALQTQYGYAITCHKAQGGEWRHVIVEGVGINRMGKEDRSRWLYTALTRSKKSVQIINPPESRVRIVDRSVFASNESRLQQHLAAQESKFLESKSQGANSQRSKSKGLESRVSKSHELKSQASNSQSSKSQSSESQERQGEERGSDADRLGIVVDRGAGPHLSEQKERLAQNQAAVWIGGAEQPAVAEAAGLEQELSEPELEDEVLTRLHARISGLLDGSGLVLEELSEHQYQFQLLVSNDAGSGRIQLYYNQKRVFTKLHAADPIALLAKEVLESLRRTGVDDPGDLKVTEDEGEERLPADTALHDIHHGIVERMSEHRIRVSLEREMKWRLRYALTCDEASLEIDVSYNKYFSVSNFQINRSDSQELNEKVISILNGEV